MHNNGTLDAWSCPVEGSMPDTTAARHRPIELRLAIDCRVQSRDERFGFIKMLKVETKGD